MNDELLYFERERENLLLVEPSFVDNGIAELYQYLVAKKKKYAL
jgi:hypothetical protein